MLHIHSLYLATAVHAASTHPTLRVPASQKGEGWDVRRGRVKIGRGRVKGGGDGVRVEGWRVKGGGVGVRVEGGRVKGGSVRVDGGRVKGGGGGVRVEGGRV